MDNFRLLAQKDEIFQLMKQAPITAIGEIWQTLPFKREVFQINKLEVLSDALIFKTRLPFDFDPNFPIFIKINYRNLIFKLSPGEYRVNHNQLSCSYPKEAKALESRAKPRTKLPKKNTLTVTLRTLSNESVLDLKVHLEDVSEIGICIRTSSLNGEFFRKNTFFKMIQVCHENQMEEAVFNVRHIFYRADKSTACIGLSADQKLSDRFFEIILDEMTRGKTYAM